MGEMGVPELNLHSVHMYFFCCVLFYEYKPVFSSQLPCCGEHRNITMRMRNGFIMPVLAYLYSIYCGHLLLLINNKFLLLNKKLPNNRNKST